MLNERRVMHMTRMALYEKHESRNYNRMINTPKKEYVSFQDMLGVIFGSVLYFIILALVVGILYSFFLTNMNRVIIILCVIATAICYIVFLYHYRSFTHARAVRRYVKAKRQIARLREDWDILEQMYKEEAEEMAPSVDETDVVSAGH